MFIVSQTNSGNFGSTSCMTVNKRVFDLAFELAADVELSLTSEDEVDAFLDTVADDYSEATVCGEGLMELVGSIINGDVSKENFYCTSVFFYESTNFKVSIGTTENLAKLAFVNGLIGE